MNDKEVLVPVRWLESLIKLSEGLGDDLPSVKVKGFISAAKILIKYGDED